MWRESIVSRFHKSKQQNHVFLRVGGSLVSLLALGSLCFALPSSSSRAKVSRVAALDPGAAPLRRLTRYEYDRTLQDLLGIEFNSREVVGMPEDTAGIHFDNLAVNLNAPPTLLEKYETATDKILENLIAGADGRVPDVGDRDRAQRAHDALFFVKPEKETSSEDAARKILQRFAEKAYRRPVTPIELTALTRLFNLATANGETFEIALSRPLKAILLSPYFLFRVEKEAPGTTPGKVSPLDDYAFATRLSYFLWASMPDDELFRLAQARKLSDPTLRAQQIRRMLADPKARSLTENFAGQWLQTRHLPGARPSQDVFPTFTSGLRDAMYKETATFFDKLREEDGNLLDLLDADYTYLNEELARHYGIEGVSGEKMQRVKLKPEYHRGGLLGMGSILSLTSHTFRTSPTLRGKWVLEVIFGTPPPPPPPGVSQIADEHKAQQKVSTFRELLAQHSTNPGCAGCHKLIDPPGFALENYDAIGRWRTSLGDKPLDTKTQFITGEKINGADEFKKLVLTRREEFTRNVVGQTLVYALGRELTEGDNETINRIALDLKKQNGRFSALVLGVVESVPFRYRRSGDTVMPAIAPGKKVTQNLTQKPNRTSDGKPQRKKKALRK